MIKPDVQNAEETINMLMFEFPDNRELLELAFLLDELESLFNSLEIPTETHLEDFINTKG